MTRKRLGRDRPGGRAVSDVIAFTIVFSIVIGSVGIVAAVGFSSLSDIKADEQTVNARRAIESLAENIGEVQRGHAPGRVGEIAVGGSGSLSTNVLDVSARDVSPSSSALFVTDDAEIGVEVTNASGGTVFDDNTTVGSLRYFLGQKNRSVGIESGAVFSRFRGNAIMNEEPKFACRNSGSSTYALVSLVEFRVGGSSAVAGGNVEIEARELSSELVFADTDAGAKNVNVTIRQSNFEDAWIDGLDDANWDASVGGGDTVGCAGVERVYVRKTVVEITLE